MQQASNDCLLHLFGWLEPWELVFTVSSTNTRLRTLIKANINRIWKLDSWYHIRTREQAKMLRVPHDIPCIIRKLDVNPMFQNRPSWLFRFAAGLTSLSVAQCRFNLREMRELGRGFRHLPMLRCLDLSGLRYGRNYRGLTFLLRCLSTLNHLESLDLSRVKCMGHENATQALTEALEHLPRLRTLILACEMVDTPNKEESLVNLLHAVPQLTHLCLYKVAFDGYYLFQEGYGALCDALERMTGLQYLRWHADMVFGYKMRPLASALYHIAPSLVELRLSDGLFDSAALELLAQLCCRFTALRTLSLVSREVNEEDEEDESGWITLAEQLHHIHFLSTLLLADCMTDSEVIEPVCKIIAALGFSNRDNNPTVIMDLDQWMFRAV